MAFLRSGSDSSILVPRSTKTDDQFSQTSYNVEVGSFSFSDVLAPLTIPSKSPESGVGDDLFLSHWVTYDFLSDPQFQSEVISDPLFQELAVLHQHNNPSEPRLNSPLSSEQHFLQEIIDFINASPSVGGEKLYTRTDSQFSDQEMRRFATICERFRSRTPRYSDSSPKGVSYHRHDRSLSPNSITDASHGGEESGWVRRLPSLPEESSYHSKSANSGVGSPPLTDGKGPISIKIPKPIRLASDSLSDVFSARGSPADQRFSDYILRLQDPDYLHHTETEDTELSKKDPPQDPNAQQTGIWEILIHSQDEIPRPKTANRDVSSVDSVFERYSNVLPSCSSLPSTPSHSMYKPLHPPPQRSRNPKPKPDKSSPSEKPPTAAAASLNTRVAGLSIKKLRSKLEKRKRKS